MKKLILKTIPVLTLILFASCENSGSIKGNHDQTKEVRHPGEFEEVINEGAFNIFISNDSVYEVTIQAESNIIPYIKTVVDGNSLIIDTKKSISANYPINIYVKSPLIKYVSLEGSGTITLDSLSAGSFKTELEGSGNIGGKIFADTILAEIGGSGNISLATICQAISTEIDGSGNINLAGRTNNATHDISGSGNISAFEFIAGNCNADISGSGSMKINVTDTLNVNISGSGSVYLMGNPHMNMKISGSGTVIRQ